MAHKMNQDVLETKIKEMKQHYLAIGQIINFMVKTLKEEQDENHDLKLKLSDTVEKMNYHKSRAEKWKQLFEEEKEFKALCDYNCLL